MTKISKAAHRLAAELVTKAPPDSDLWPLDSKRGQRALTLYIQETSDAAKEADELFGCFSVDGPARRKIQCLILPDDEPDPLAKAIDTAWADIIGGPADHSRAIRAALDAAGYQITRK